MSEILQIKNLNINFGDNPAVVKNLSFNLSAGETLAIVGESGSGKSVTSLALMGLLPKIAHVKADFFTFLGDDLHAYSEENYRNIRGKQISMIFQEPMTSLNPAMRCGHQVAEALQMHMGINAGEAREETIRWFERVKLPTPEEMYLRYPHQLSGGQRQRVMIAMAMCTKPKLLIADEPTTALDVTVQKNILQLLRDLQKEMGMAMIFITHDLGVVKEVADDVLVLYRGQMQEYGSAAQVINRPTAPYTQGLLASRPPIHSRPHRLPTVDEFLNPSEKQTMAAPRREPSAHAEVLLEVKNLYKFFPGKREGFFGKKQKNEVLKQIDLTVYKGETLGLVGESGCGKSTLGRSIIRLLQPDGGQIFYKGKDISTLKGDRLRKLRKHIQIIFQDPYSSLNPLQRIGDAIVEPMLVHKLHDNENSRKQKAEELLEKVGLKAEFYNRYPHEFSGGQRQRIGIARALAVEPEIIICDESVSALDVSVQARVLNLLNDLKDEFGLTYIFISHDLSVVKYFSNRVAVMNKGEIVELNKADELYLNPQNDYTKQLIDSVPGLDNQSF